MNHCLARLTLVCLVAAALVFTGSLTVRGAFNPQTARVVVKKSWPIEPIKIVSVKTRNNVKIELGQSFDEDDDWLDGLVVTVANNYDKPVTALTISLVFRRQTGDTRPPFAWNLHFGPSPLTVEYSQRDRHKVINAGETLELPLTPANYATLKRGFAETGYAESIQRVELEVKEVGFEDGSMLYSGTLYLQDPAYPNDPTKKIKAVRPVTY
jgi:hypothetical protein